MEVQSTIDNRQSEIDPYSIPVLSVCQPYAHLIVHGPKRIENRTWATKYRGWIGIHASTGRRYMKDRDDFEALNGKILMFGAVIGVAKLAACIRREQAQGTRQRALHPMPNASMPDAFGWVFDDPWFEGPVGWVLLEARSIEPIVCRGKTGLFRLPKRGNAET